MSQLTFSFLMKMLLRLCLPTVRWTRFIIITLMEICPDQQVLVVKNHPHRVIILNMKTAILLTGAPRCGKTTLLQKVLVSYTGPAGGFYTREVRKDGRRTAFEMVTLDGKTGILAGVHLPGPPRVSKYGVDLDALECVAIPAIRRGPREWGAGGD